MTPQEALRNLVLNGDELYAQICTVTSVDGLKCECEPVNGDAPILDVRLVADESEKRVVLIPAVGSIVLVQFITKEAAYVAMVSDVSEISYKVGEVEYSLTADGYLVKKEDDTLKEILTLMVEALQPVVVLYGNNPDYGKLTTALAKINNLLR